MAAGDEGFKYSGEGRTHDPAWRVVIAPGSSRLALVWILAVAISALAAALASDAPALARAGISCALICFAVDGVRRHALRRGAGVVERLAVDLAGKIEVDGQGRSSSIGRVAAGSFVAPWLIVVHWIPDGARFARTIFLLPDMADPEELRRLRVLLRWGH